MSIVGAVCCCRWLSLTSGDVGGGCWRSVAVRVCVAQCPHERSHQPPVVDCCCGTYGSLSLSALTADFGDLTENIVAVVSMEGPRIIVADCEVRASAAQVGCSLVQRIRVLMPPGRCSLSSVRQQRFSLIER